MRERRHLARPGRRGAELHLIEERLRDRPSPDVRCVLELAHRAVGVARGEELLTLLDRGHPLGLLGRRRGHLRGVRGRGAGGGDGRRAGPARSSQRPAAGEGTSRTRTSLPPPRPPNTTSQRKNRPAPDPFFRLRDEGTAPSGAAERSVALRFRELRVRRSRGSLSSSTSVFAALIPGAALRGRHAFVPAATPADRRWPRARSGWDRCPR